MKIVGGRKLIVTVVGVIGLAIAGGFGTEIGQGIYAWGKGKLSSKVSVVEEKAKPIESSPPDPCAHMRPTDEQELLRHLRYAAITKQEGAIFRAALGSGQSCRAGVLAAQINEPGEAAAHALMSAGGTQCIVHLLEDELNIKC